MWYTYIQCINCNFKSVYEYSLFVILSVLMNIIEEGYNFKGRLSTTDY